MTNAGFRFRKLLTQPQPLVIVGTVNAYTAMMATQLGHRAIYLSGAGCANNSYGLPDLGMTSLTDVLADVHRITSAVDTPLLVDIDTGWGNSLNIARTIREMIKAGVAAVHLEDQVTQKRCGHRPNKAIVPPSEMVDRIRSAVDARTDDNFFLIARTDAYAREGLSAAIERAQQYLEAGADGIFAEALLDLEDYREFKTRIDAPLLANLTEFGKTPLFGKTDLHEAGVDMILYPLTATRAMNHAAENVYRELLKDQSQSELIDNLQSRDVLYQYLGYLDDEKKIDDLFGSNSEINDLLE